jgi:adenylate cyclase
MLEVALYNPRQHKQFCRDSGPLVLARASQDAALWVTADEPTACADARIEIVPQLAGVSLAISGGKTKYQKVPTSITCGDTRFEINLAKRGTLRPPLQRLRTDNRNLRSQNSSPSGPSPATLSRWFAALSSLNHWATSLQELYVQAAQCAVEAIGLDGGMVLRLRDNQWEIAASYLPHPELGIHYDVAALDELHASPQTLFHGSAECTPLAPREETCSRSEQTTLCEPAIVLSPLRNAAGELAGAIYGYRSIREGNARHTIRYLEAHMIELLAGAVCEGIARIEREAETDRRRVLLEQAAAISQSQWSREIVTDEREVTLLFADLRNSTALSDALPPNETYELLSQVMECLTAAVIDHDGLVIDYYGDGLTAMWNAPADQSDHAELACRAALRMLQTLPSISSDWGDLLHCKLQLGIGVHTGIAHVGNTGTRRRSKYGPRGKTVNLTSRIEAATRQFDLPLLITSATAARLSNRFATHRICRAQIRGFEQPVDLHSLSLANSDADSAIAWQTYHEALQLFEQGRLQEAAEHLATIDTATTEIPSRFLADNLNGELARQRRRRSTDRGSDTSRGVIKLSAK